MDHSVLVYFWLPNRFEALAEAAKAKDGMWASPVSWRAEFRSVLAEYLRRKKLTLSEALAVYLNAQRDLADREFSVPPERILKLALSSNCSAYDCEYVGLAMDLDVPLVTTDGRILREFPKIAVSLENFAVT